MKVTILTDNIAGGLFKAEHGLSYLIEIDGEKILFDTGHSDVFLQNASNLGIEIQTQEVKVVLSHGHWDHGNGLVHLSNQKLIAHPGVFAKRFRKKDHSYLGLDLDEQKASEKFQLLTTAVPYSITRNLWFLGEIPRIKSFEAKHTSYLLENGEEDFVLDDTALVAKTGKGLVVISGCAHSGICNICEQAKKVSGISKIHTVMGGFHLKDQGEQTQKTLEYFQENQIGQILPSHCTELPAKELFRKKYDFQEVKTGMSFEF